MRARPAGLPGKVARAKAMHAGALLWDSGAPAAGQSRAPPPATCGDQQVTACDKSVGVQPTCMHVFALFDAAVLVELTHVFAQGSTWRVTTCWWVQMVAVHSTCTLMLLGILWASLFMHKTV